MKELAESLIDASVAEIWTIHLTQRTLAKGDALLEYICRAKIVNGIPKTEKEQEYVDSLRASLPLTRSAECSTLGLSVGNGPKRQDQETRR